MFRTFTSAWIGLVALLSVTFTLGGCANDCEKLVDRSCAKLGADSAQCQAARELASDASETDLKTCRKLAAGIELLFGE